jgi:hypothetical protein
VVVLDDDDTVMFETLLRLAAIPNRPAVVLLTRRAYASVLTPDVLEELGVDRLVAWPCRVSAVVDAIESTRREIPTPVRLAS